MHKLCSICSVPVDSENASILVMGGFGNPRYVCEECSQDLDLLTESRDAEEIKAAMGRIIDKTSTSAANDDLVYETIKNILNESKIRAESIQNGIFEEKESKDADADDEIPEELLESSEDAELDAIEAQENIKREKAFDKFVMLPLLLAFIAFLIYFFFIR